MGFGLVEYFRNAIDSVIKWDQGANVLAICTGGFDAAEWGSFAESYRALENVRFYSIPHLASGKCGSLYDGYSLAIEKAIKLRIKYLNIIQNDMQLLWWDSKIETLYKELFNANSSACMVQTGFFRKGSHPDAHYSKSWVKRQLVTNVFKQRFYFYESTTAGMSDWGIISIERFLKFKVLFIGNEGDLGRRSYERGLRLITSPIPCVAPLPWPVVVRNGRERGVMPIRGDTLYLSPKKVDSLQLLLEGGDLMIFQEDCVTQCYWALTPIWATEMDMEYFRIRSKNRRADKNPFLRYEKNGVAAVFWPIFCSTARPNILDLIKVYCANLWHFPKTILKTWMLQVLKILIYSRKN